jgi:hypothetical protein
MASRPPVAEPDDELELTPDMEADELAEPDDEDVEGEGEDEAEPEADDGAGEDDGEGETVIGFADDEADQADKADSPVIRRIRERNRELARENAELRRRQEPPPEVQLGPKPTLSDCDFDEEKFETALMNWNGQRARIEAQQSERVRQSEAIDQEWRRDLASYEAKRAALGVADFDEVIEPVKNSLSLAQQAVIIKVAQDPVTFVYALGRSDGRLAELTKIHDPIKLAGAVARMEGGVKVTKKRKAPAPDRPVRGGARMPGSSDKVLEKLEAEAAKTGNRTPVIQYKKKLAARGKK